jgi:Tfp pilus assembly protein PilX
MRHKQKGVTLVLSLIMLVLLTIMALSSFTIGKSSLQVVDNAQQQAQAQNAAQAILDQVVSTPTFAENPGNVLDNSNCPAGMAPPVNSRCVDLYGDGKTVIVVAMSPQPFCTQVKSIPAASLDLTKTEDAACTVEEKQQFGIDGVISGASLCSDSMWELNAEATERVSLAKTVVTQGIEMRVSNDAVSTACP